MAEVKAVPGLLRTLNERTVLDAIRASSPVSRAELARQTGISKPTVSLALRALLEDGLVRETEHDPDRPHFGAVYYEADPEAAHVLGIDLGAGALRMAVCDLSGRVRAKHESAGRGSLEQRVDTAAKACRTLLRSAGLPTELLDRAVVGVPGIVSEPDGRVFSADIPELETSAVREELERRLRVPVTLENDVNLAALGEQRHGVAQGEDDFGFLLVGEGLGAAVVLGGTLYRGRNGAAGELDSVRSERPDDVDPCASALAAVAPEDLVEETARRIALHIVPLAATLDLPLVVLGGTIGGDERLLDPIRSRLAEWLPFPPRVEVSPLGETAVLDGALAAGLDAALEHVFERRVRS